MNQIIEQLNTIAENEQKVYDAGYSEGLSDGGVSEADKQEIADMVIENLPIADVVEADNPNPVSSDAVSNEFGRFSEAYDDIINQAVVRQEIFYNDAILDVEHNKDYHAVEDISELHIRIMSGNDLCSITFKIIDSGDFVIDFMGVNGYIGKAPDFKNGETWELSIHNGIVVGGKVE